MNKSFRNILLSVMLTSLLWLLLGAAPPSPIWRNQFTTNIPPAPVIGDVVFANNVEVGNLVATNNGSVSFATNATAADVFLVRDNAPNTLGQRNGTIPQTNRVYGTFTDSANFERVALFYDGVQFTLGTEKGGAGAVRPLRLNSSASGIAIDSGATISFRNGAGAIMYWQITTTALVAGTDDTYNIGVTNASRPKILYLSRGLVIGPNSGGGFVTNILTARGNFDFPNTLAQTSSDIAITVTGCTTNDVATCSQPPTIVTAGGMLSCISSNDTVWVRFNNYTAAALNPGPADVAITVTRF